MKLILCIILNALVVTSLIAKVERIEAGADLKSVSSLKLNENYDILFDSHTPPSTFGGYSSPNAGLASQISVEHDFEISGISILNRMHADGALRFVILGGPQFDVLLATPAVDFSYETDASWKKSPPLSFTLQGGGIYLIGYVRSVGVEDFGDRVAESQYGITSSLQVATLSGFDSPSYSHHAFTGPDNAFRLYAADPVISSLTVSTNNLVHLEWTNSGVETWIDQSTSLQPQGWDTLVGPLTNSSSWSGFVDEANQRFFRIRSVF